MSRNVKTLFNVEPPASQKEIRSSPIPFVGKLSGGSHYQTRRAPRRSWYGRC
jgi:hypothetical protein